MSVTIKSGTLSDFFASAKETAREIDEGLPVTPKNIVWIEPNELRSLLKPERTKLIKYLRQHERVLFSELLEVMQRTPSSLNHDLEILLKYQLIRVFKESNPGHGVRKVVESNLKGQPLQVVAEF